MQHDDASKPDPLSVARERGRLYALREYSVAENLTPASAAVKAGCSIDELHARTLLGHYYYLPAPGPIPGMRFPSWQFRAENGRLSMALQPFILARTNAWVLHTFMISKHTYLGGMPACDYICDDKQPMDVLIRLIEAQLQNEQGS